MMLTFTFCQQYLFSFATKIVGPVFIQFSLVGILLKRSAGVICTNQKTTYFDKERDFHSIPSQFIRLHLSKEINFDDSPKRQMAY